MVAVNDEGKAVGACICYDGAKLHELRKPFFEAVMRILDKDMTDVQDETDPLEVYLDTLAGLPGGFNKAGERPFAYVMMDHLRCD